MFLIYQSLYSKAFKGKSFLARFPYCTKKSDSSPTKDLYTILDVHPHATQSEIKKAYYNLTLLYHPDRNEGCPDAANKFKEVAEAYEILGNILTRDMYDKGISIPVDKETLKPKRKPIDHESKWQQFYDRRNNPFIKPRSTLGDTTSDFRVGRNFERKSEEEEDPQERQRLERFKHFAFFMLMIAIIYRTRVRQSEQ